MFGCYVNDQLVTPQLVTHEQWVGNTNAKLRGIRFLFVVRTKVLSARRFIMPILHYLKWFK
ncbi:hypothetical protein MiSe_18920 [Microseira wollei NIES-4236]|uniref:Uncharacterized protein n=1 Tax=Microseira wollei NIES-4236 TaxID=2530354 RepID=A0AAV3X9T2_9CYAN|nr:hypothetical protein MiSe_18920 [Microseira wollei NIES-4236]